MKRGQLEARVLTLVTLGLVAFGLVMVYSATSASATLANGDPAYFLKRQAGYALLGLVLMVAASRLDYRVLRRLAPALVVTSLSLLLAVLVLGQAVNGARRWITLGPLVFQPSELAKLALAVWAASYLTRRRPPQTLKQLWRPISIAGVASLLAVWFEPYRRARLFSFINPWHDAQGAGYQTVQAIIGLGSGGVFGRGLGQSIEKANFLPEAHTDMIFAIIGEELGLIGAAAVIAAYGAFAYFGLRIALSCKDPFGKRLAAGLTVLVCGQAAINLAAVMGLAPLTGIPLPFVSYGGSSLVVALVSVGILLNIAGDAGARRASVSDSGRGNSRPRAARARRRASAARPRRASDVRRVSTARRGAARS